MDRIANWLKEQSTWKAIVVLLGVIGYHVAPERVGEILTAVGVFYALIAGFWDGD
uniref:Holin n=1 Tax=viral metagenome TaxID=1070528 RepID=A0A6M3XNH9_9ZZZZ